MNAQPNEIDSWEAEKASRVVDCLASARDILGKGGLSNDQVEHADFLVGSAIWDATKILARITRSQWSVDDASDVQCNGHKGYERVAVKYGVIHRSKEDVQRSTLKGYAEALALLIGGDRSPNRTFVHELLNSTSLDHPLVQKTARIVELVTQGQLEWKDFGRIMEAELRELNLI